MDRRSPIPNGTVTVTIAEEGKSVKVVENVGAGDGI
jgi:hypothetical protein